MHDAPSPSFTTSPSPWEWDWEGLRSVYRNIWATFYAFSLIPQNPQLRLERPKKAFLILGHKRSKINLSTRNFPLKMITTTFAASHPFQSSQSLPFLPIAKRCRTFMLPRQYLVPYVQIKAFCWVSK